MKPDPVDLRMTRSCTPETTQTRRSPALSSVVTTVVRNSGPRRTNEWSCPRPSTSMRSQAYSSIPIRDAVAFGAASRKWAPRASPNCSGEMTPFSLAKAKAVFFCVSVGSTSP